MKFNLLVLLCVTLLLVSGSVFSESQLKNPNGMMLNSSVVSSSAFTISKSLTEQKIDVRTKATGVSIVPKFDNVFYKEDVPLVISFKQKPNDSYKYDLNFYTGDYTSFSLVFDTEEKVFLNDNKTSARTNKLFFDFNDVVATGIKFELLQLSDYSFSLNLTDLEKQKDYYIDPLIQQWYSSVYQERIDLNVVNNSGIGMDINHSVGVILNTTSAVHFPDKNCIAIVYNTTTELDSNVEAFGTASTKVFFKIAAPITIGNSADKNYSLYTRCSPVPTNPKRNMARDDFEDGDFSNWTSYDSHTGGDCSTSRTEANGYRKLYGYCTSAGANDLMQLQDYENAVIDLNKNFGIKIPYYRFYNANTGTNKIQIGLSDSIAGYESGNETLILNDTAAPSSATETLYVQRKTGDPTQLQYKIDSGAWNYVSYTAGTNLAALHLFAKIRGSTVGAGFNNHELWLYDIFYYNEQTASDGNVLLSGTFIDYNSFPTLTSVTASPIRIWLTDTITITPTGQGDYNFLPIRFLCAEGSGATRSNTLCSEGDTNWSYPYGAMKCTYVPPAGSTHRNVYCRTDNNKFSPEQSTAYDIYPNYLTIAFTNEKTGAGVKPDTLTIDGNSWLGFVDANGLFYIPSLTAIPIGFHSIVATKTGFGNRSWDINLGLNLGGDYNFAMLPLGTGKTISFKYYAPDQTTILSNYHVTAKHVSGLTAGVGLTTSSGNITFYLDSNNANSYSFDLNGTNNYHYVATTVHVLIPVNEKTQLPVALYHMQLSGIGSGQDYNGLTTGIDINIFNNTVDFYKFVFDDANAGVYLQSSLLQKVIGNVASLILQPYLVPIAFGINSTMIAQDPYGKVTIPNVLVFVTRDYNGTQTTTFSNFTDSAGSISLSWLYLQDYNVLFYYPDTNNLVYSALIAPKSNTYYAFLALTGIVGTHVAPVFSDINFTPISTTGTQAGKFDQNIGTANVTSVNITITNGSNVVYNQTFTSADANFLNGHFEQNPTVDSNSPVIITTTAILENGKTMVASQTYFMKTSLLISEIKALPNELGIMGSMLLALLIATLAVGGLSSTLMQGTAATSIIGMIVLGFFTYVEWINPLFYFSLLFAWFSVFMLSKRDSE